MTITYEQLTDGQKLAVEKVKAAMNKQGANVTINGPAGTGKTTLTKFLLDELMKDGVNGIMLAAPTHAAKKVLSNLSGKEAQTIHSLLKINPNTYEDTSTFEQSDVPDLSECRVLICDEGSMYDKKLFTILMNSVPSWCTIIGIGDKSQIRPVAPGSSVPELSLFFEHPKFEQVELTEVKRSNAPIIEVATEIRNGGWIRHSVDENGNGIHDLRSNDGKSVANFMQKYFSIVKTPEDLMENRILAYTNSTVNTLNKIVRKRIYNTEESFINDEVLVMQEPVIKKHSFEGKQFTEILYNNGEYVRIIDCQKIVKVIRIAGVPEEERVECWSIDCISLDTAVKATICVIDDEKELMKFNAFMGKIATMFKEQKTTHRPNWKSWWTVKGSFHKVKPLPVGTIHKSQGSSIDNVFLYTACITKADYQLSQQLLYVGATRARHNVYFI